MEPSARTEFNKMDRRKHTRFVKRLEARIVSDHISFLSISSDLSESGIFIRTNRGCNVETPVDIELSLPGNRVSFLKGIVRRTIRTPFSALKNGMGIEIIEKDETFRDFVKSISGKRKENVVEEQTPPELQKTSSLNCEVAYEDQRNSTQKRRRHKRLKVEHMNIDSEIPSATYAKIIDISESGVLMKANRKLDIGQNYALKIEYGNKVLVVKAEVVWSLMDDNVEESNGTISPLYIAGMQFKDILKGEITEIINLIQFDLNIISYLESPSRHVYI
jgi:hypothetical protein